MEISTKMHCEDCGQLLNEIEIVHDTGLCGDCFFLEFDEDVGEEEFEDE